MKAASYRRYGGPEIVEIVELPDPVPGPQELVVRMTATVIGSSDDAGRSGRPAFARLFFGLRRPKRPVLGWHFVGTVETVGSAVTRFRSGDRVFGTVGSVNGAHAELILVSEESALLPAPDRLSDDELVSLIDGTLTALPFLRDAANVRPGQHVLINGATGAVGIAAVQLAKHFGAHVTAVCRSANFELARSLGADEVVDYTVEDFSRSGREYDVVFDVAAASSFGRSRRSLVAGGLYLTTVPSVAILLRQALTARSRGRRGRILFTGLHSTAAKIADLAELSRLIDGGRMAPVVDSRFTLDDIVGAHRRVAGGGKTGNVVVTAPVS
jgi:NADPH:quinone reductase-like Zn-dependent oxidoreductase